MLATRFRVPAAVSPEALIAGVDAVVFNLETQHQYAVQADASGAHLLLLTPLATDQIADSVAFGGSRAIVLIDGFFDPTFAVYCTQCDSGIRTRAPTRIEDTSDGSQRRRVSTTRST